MAITNEQMKANRFKKWADARKRYNWIMENLRAGRTVYVTTYTKATKYTAKHAEMFKATKGGLYVQRGKNWDCLDYCGLVAE